MGTGIAHVSLKSKYDVTLVDVDSNALGRAQKTLNKNLKPENLNGLTSSTDVERLKKSDIVI